MYLIELVYVPPEYLLCGGPETFLRTATYPVLNRPTGQKGSNNVTNAETLHHFLNSGIDNFHDITRPNIGNSILHWMLIYVKLTTFQNKY
jgi:hypothetical protein